MSELKTRLLGQTMNEYGCDTKIYLKSEADKVIADLEEKVEELTGELRIAKPTFKCAECGEVGPHKWVWNEKEGADFVARRCCNKCIKEKCLTLWPRVHECEEKCKEFNALKAEIAERKEKYNELAKLHDKAIQACCDADKVIEELEDKLKVQTSIAEEGWKDAGIYHTSYAEAVKELYDKNKELRHHKYKRCVAMADYCYTNVHCIMGHRLCALSDRKKEWFERWHKRWLELAEKFNEGVQCRG